MKKNRRQFVKVGFWGSALALVSSHSNAASPTPKEIKGPFYPVVAQKDQDFDLTQYGDSKEVAKGQVVFIEGRVLDTQNNPIEDAMVDIWQANAAGKYNHPLDTHDAPIDPNFQGWAIVKSGKNGAFRFKTIIPGTYPVNDKWTRPPHIHFKVSKSGYAEIITQMYFPDHELNAPDRLLNSKSEPQQAQMIASHVQNKKDTLEYNVILDKV